MASRATRSPTTVTLGDDARAAMRDVATRWQEVLSAVPKARELDRAQDFARFFGLKTKLAWQFWRAMHADGPAEMLEHLPGEPGLQLVWAAIATKAGSQGPLKRLRSSVEGFRALARVHAGGDRSALAGMLVQLDPPRREKIDLQHREAAFQAARHLWGVQAGTTLALSILHPGSRPDLMDVVALRATLGFQRLRSDVPWIIARVGCYPRDRAEKADSVAQDDDAPRREPIFATKPGEPSIIASLSSKPLPPMRAIARTPTLADIELRPGPVGELAAMDIVVGDVYRNLPRFRRPDHAPEIAPILFTPCETYIHDLVVHDGAEPEGAFQVTAYGDPRGEGIEQVSSRAMLPVELRAVYVGRGREAIELTDVPRYRAMVESVHDRLGWRSGSFTVYRVTWKFPLTPSVASVTFKLPEKL